MESFIIFLLGVLSGVGICVCVAAIAVVKSGAKHDSAFTIERLPEHESNAAPYPRYYE
ncbi:hypothetical protein [Paraburkholderia diazotrophica]|uniref:Uncharacterized protein n=1 Tax=Paraburkholderia diazotrophica TaxID=667676 RepID=A0A1H6QQW6_9BURK|nr:hypothetical protein [Paraburkholderia diazotrophica]SEI41840.1 hypothetical protein SAMN05192539_1001280 [Paraburkholderia diazotrophica]